MRRSLAARSAAGARLEVEKEAARVALQALGLPEVAAHDGRRASIICGSRLDHHTPPASLSERDAGSPSPPQLPAEPTSSAGSTSPVACVIAELERGATEGGGGGGVQTAQPHHEGRAATEGNRSGSGVDPPTGHTAAADGPAFSSAGTSAGPPPPSPPPPLSPLPSPPRGGGATPLRFVAAGSGVSVDSGHDGGTVAEVRRIDFAWGQAAACEGPPMHEGVHYAEFSLLRLGSGSRMLLGAYCDPVDLELSPVRWGARFCGVYSRGGHLRLGGRWLRWPEMAAFKEGDVVGLELDCDRGRLSVYLNRGLLGEATASVGGGELRHLAAAGGGLRWVVGLETNGDAVRAARRAPPSQTAPPAVVVRAVGVRPREPAAPSTEPPTAARGGRGVPRVRARAAVATAAATTATAPAIVITSPPEPEPEAEAEAPPPEPGCASAMSSAAVAVPPQSMCEWCARGEQEPLLEEVVSDLASMCERCRARYESIWQQLEVGGDHVSALSTV
jgi:hypothetical protein